MPVHCTNTPSNPTPEHHASSAAETVASNEDLITEILVRVPAQPLLTFKCVSKQCLSLISDPNFSRRHTLQNPTSKISAIFLRTNPGLSESRYEFVSLSTNHSEAPFRSLNFTHDPAGIKILQSCNGLLLCCSFRRIGTVRSYYVYNPTTKQFLKLPPLVGHECVTIFGVNLAFEPSKSPHYKVVCVRSTPTSLCCYQIEIYSSEKRSWRLSGDPFTAPFDMVFDNGMFWNGSIHWISPTRATLYVDVDKECLGTMPTLPALESSGKRRFRWFGECRGHLHLIEIHGPRITQFRVYEMERDYSRWFVKYEVDLGGIVAAFPEMVRDYLDPYDSNYYAFVLLFLVREENEEESSLLLHIPGKVISYNFKDKTFKNVFELEPDRMKTNSSLQFGWLDAYQYIETLACV